MKTITSTTNPEVKNIAQLHSKKGRREQKQFIGEGLRVCQTIAKTLKPNAVYVVKDLLHEAEQLCETSKIKVVTDEVMKKISAASTPSGLVTVFAIPEQPALTELSDGIVLAGLRDPGNVGTLIRTATALNKKTVVLVNSVDPYNPKVVQGSAGALAHVNLFHCTWPDLTQHKKNLSLIGLVIEGGAPPQEISTKNNLIVIGSEARGIAQEFLDDCDQTLTLPMPGQTESLNAAVAGSIALYLLG